eukprot:341857-Rhodomonas_salina.3
MDNVGPGNCMMVACKIYFAKQFEELREHYCRECGGEDGLLQVCGTLPEMGQTHGAMLPEKVVGVGEVKGLEVEEGGLRG